jgi:hypothetical protein
MQEDPIQFQAGDPNLRRYVGNNPVTNTDPSGLIVHVFAFEGAAGYQPDEKKLKGGPFELGSGALLRINYLQPAKEKFGSDVVIHYYANNQISKATSDAARIAQTPAFAFLGRSLQHRLGIDRSPTQYDRIVIIGYSWGGYAAAELAKNLKENTSAGAATTFARIPGKLHFGHVRPVKRPISADLVFTVDPVSKVLPGKAIPITRSDVFASNWYNYYQQSDTGSLAGVARIRGSAIEGATQNILVTPLALRGATTGIPEFDKVATEYKDIKSRAAHIFIPGVPSIKEKWLNELGRVVRQGNRDTPAGWFSIE